MLNFVGVSSSTRAILQDCMCPLSSLHWSPLLVSNGGACTTLPEKKWIPINLWTKKTCLHQSSIQTKVSCLQKSCCKPKERLLGYVPAIQLQTPNENALIRLRLHGTRKGGGAPDTALNAWNMETTHGMLQMDMHNICAWAMVCAHIPVEDIHKCASFFKHIVSCTLPAAAYRRGCIIT